MRKIQTAALLLGALSLLTSCSREVLEIPPAAAAQAALELVETLGAVGSPTTVEIDIPRLEGEGCTVLGDFDLEEGQRISYLVRFESGGGLQVGFVPEGSDPRDDQVLSCYTVASYGPGGILEGDMEVGAPYCGTYTLYIRSLGEALLGVTGAVDIANGGQ